MNGWVMGRVGGVVGGGRGGGVVGGGKGWSGGDF